MVTLKRQGLPGVLGGRFSGSASQSKKITRDPGCTAVNSETVNIYMSIALGPALRVHQSLQQSVDKGQCLHFLEYTVENSDKQPYELVA